MTTGTHRLRPTVKKKPSHVVRKAIHLRKAGVCQSSRKLLRELGATLKPLDAL